MLKVMGPAVRNHQDWFDENDAVIEDLKQLLLWDHQCNPQDAAKRLFLPTYAAQSKPNCTPCKTTGSAPKMMRSKALPISMLSSVSILPYKQLMVHPPQDYPFSTLMDQLYSPTRATFCKDGLNTF